MTADERLAQCLANGGDPGACHDLLAAEMVGGVWCDGSIVYDANGKRCVPRALVERAAAARAGSPLPRAAVVASSQPAPSLDWKLLIALGFGAAVLVWYAAR